jgi:serine/threonine protein kinase
LCAGYRPGYYELPNAKIIGGLPQQTYNMINTKFKFLSPAGQVRLPSPSPQSIQAKLTPANLRSYFQDLIKRFLTFDPKKRITAYQALQHPYFTESPLPKSPDMMPTFPTKHNTGYRRARRHVDLSCPCRHHLLGFVMAMALMSDI